MLLVGAEKKFHSPVQNVIRMLCKRQPGSESAISRAAVQIESCETLSGSFSRFMMNLCTKRN